MKHFIINDDVCGTGLAHTKIVSYMLDNEATTLKHACELYEAATLFCTMRRYEALVGSS
jgi:hypothetical protein